MRKSFFLLAALALGGCLHQAGAERTCVAMLRMARTSTDTLIAYTATPDKGYVSCGYWFTNDSTARLRAGASR